jgi:cell division protease FtsH
MNKHHFHIGYAIAAIIGVVLIQYVVSTAHQVATIPYSQFQQLIREGKVESVGVSDRFIQGTLKEPLQSGQKRFITTRVDPQFSAELDKYGVRSSRICSPGSCLFSFSEVCGGTWAGAWPRRV